MKKIILLKRHILSAGLIFTLLFLNSCAVNYQLSKFSKGKLNTIQLEAKEGKASIHLPRLYSGDVVSGQVVIEPLGDTRQVKDRNKTALEKYGVELTGKSHSLDANIYKLPIPKGSRTLPVTFMDPKGEVSKVLEMDVIPNMPPSRKGFFIPSYLVADEPTFINGNFDGDFNTTQIQINDQPILPLAESTQTLTVNAPMHLVGPAEFQLIEGSTRVEQECNILELQLTADKLRLKKGESTTLRVRVNGLEDLENPVPLNISNVTPSTITMEGGNLQTLLIDPRTEAPGGTFMKTFVVQSLITGDFTVNAFIDPADDDEVVEENDLCDCRIDGRSYLLSRSACYQLSGKPYEGSPDLSSEVDEDISLPVDQSIGSVQPSVTPQKQVQFNLSPNEWNKDVVSASLSYQNLNDTNWTSVEPERPGFDSHELQWDASEVPGGMYLLRTRIVDKDQHILQTTHFTQIGNFTVSDAHIRRAEERARRTREQIEQEEAVLAELRRRQREKEEEKKENENLADELEKIDEVLDRVPRVYKPKLKAILDSLENLRKQLPAKIDTAALQAAVDDAKARLKACQDRLENLKKEKAELEKERDDLKSQMDDALEEMDRLHFENGWVGGHGYHADGRPWYGYVGDENANTDIMDEQYELKKKLRTLKKPHLNALKRLKELPAEIEAAQEECDKLNEEVQKAMEAAKKGAQYVGAQLAKDDLCRQIRSLLKPLLRWCRAHPGACDFEDKLQEMLDDCPDDRSSLDDYWEDFDSVTDQKKEQEEEYENDAADDQEEIDDLEDKIGNGEDRVRELEEEERKQYADTEALKRQKAKEAEAAAKREEERKKAERERKKVKPQPYLDEEIDPSDDQLKFQAQGMFRGLHTDYFVSHGPCDCRTKAIALANNTNSIVTDLIGRIGVAVIFAPLEAFPGTSLATRLGLGVLKAIAGNLFGGENLPEGLLKNLFSVVGGELFPKLAGNEFVGNKVKDLADKGLEEILEAEGVRAIQWEDTTKLRNCGKVSGKTTLLVNPKTGWVVIMIKIPGCPLVVIKYKVNDDGVPISKPTVETVK